MLRAISLLAPAALGFALLFPASAPAQPIDQDSAQVLRQTLQSWLSTVLGPRAGADAAWLRVTPESDHFRVTVPFAAAAGGAEITADVRPQPDGIWSVDALRLPPASQFTLNLPAPGGPPGVTVPTRIEVHIGNQAAHGIVDPTLTRPSRFDADLGNVDVASQSPRLRQQQHIDHDTVQVALQPRAGGLDLVEQGTLTGWRTASQIEGKPATGYGADRIAASGRIEGIDPSHATALLTAIGGLVATLPPGTAPRGALSPPARAALRTLIESLRNVFTGIQAEESISGLHVAIANKGEATVRQVTFGLNGGAPDGRLHAMMNVALDGIAVQDLPPSAQALVPRHVVLRPTIAGVSMAALTRLALAATEQDANKAAIAAQAEALLASGGVTIGLDALDADIGPASLRGAGQVQVIAPGAYDAHARITATGFDALMQQAAGNPELQRALPVLAMARGFAQQDGDRLVWDVVLTPAGFTVNGVPLGRAPGQPPQPDRR